MEDLGERFTAAFQRKYEEGVAAERARCIKALEDLIEPSTFWNALGRFEPPLNAGLRAGIAALKANAAVPVASSPVGGEQHG